MKDHIIHNDFEVSTPPAREKIVQIVSRASGLCVGVKTDPSVKQEWKLSRETETPAFTGRIDGMENDSDKSSTADLTPEELEAQKLKEMIRLESVTFFNTFIQMPQGKREFGDWMWKKVIRVCEITHLLRQARWQIMVYQPKS